MDEYVTSFETAKRLKAAGFPQSTVHKHYQVIVTGKTKLIAGSYEDLTVGGKQTRTFGAPLTDELRIQLPDKIHDRFVKLEIRTFGASVVMPILVEESLQPVNRDQHYHPDYNDLVLDDETPIDTLPNALAELWLWCQDSGYLEPR